MTDIDYIAKTKNWIEKVVIGLNLCPFAAQPLMRDKLLFILNEGSQENSILEDVNRVLHQLIQKKAETAIIIAPNVDLDFESWYYYISDLQEHVDNIHIDSFVLVAFHPQFQYANSNIEDTSNATNRSPYPMIHILKSESLTRASESDIDLEQLVDDNKELLSTMSWDQLRSLYH